MQYIYIFFMLYIDGCTFALQTVNTQIIELHASLRSWFSSLPCPPSQPRIAFIPRKMEGEKIILHKICNAFPPPSFSRTLSSEIKIGSQFSNSILSVHFLEFHPAVLKPDFDLSVC